MSLSLFSFGLMYQCLNGAIPSKKCSIQALAMWMWSNSAYVLIEICHQRSKWLAPKSIILYDNYSEFCQHIFLFQINNLCSQCSLYYKFQVITLEPTPYLFNSNRQGVFLWNRIREAFLISFGFDSCLRDKIFKKIFGIPSSCIIGNVLNTNIKNAFKYFKTAIFHFQIGTFWVLVKKYLTGGGR